MPDHRHLLVEGTDDASDLRKFVSLAKQYSSYEYSVRGNGRLWQPSYFDHVLRREESTARVVAYIMNNPIRGGYATTFGEYRFAGSETVSMEGMGELLSEESSPPWEP